MPTFFSESTEPIYLKVTPIALFLLNLTTKVWFIKIGSIKKKVGEGGMRISNIRYPRGATA